MFLLSTFNIQWHKVYVSFWKGEMQAKEEKTKAKQDWTWQGKQPIAWCPVSRVWATRHHVSSNRIGQPCSYALSFTVCTQTLWGQLSTVPPASLIDVHSPSPHWVLGITPSSISRSSLHTLYGFISCPPPPTWPVSAVPGLCIHYACKTNAIWMVLSSVTSLRSGWRPLGVFTYGSN